MRLTIPITDLKPYERLANGRLVTAVKVSRDTVDVTFSGGKTATYPASYEADIEI